MEELIITQEKAIKSLQKGYDYLFGQDRLDMQAALRDACPALLFLRQAAFLEQKTYPEVEVEATRVD